MVGESLAIIAVILVMAAMVARSGRHLFSALTLPLITIPVFHLVGSMVGPRSWLPVLDGVALLMGCALCVFFSRSIVSKRGRKGYLLFCVAFMVALLIAYLKYLL